MHFRKLTPLRLATTAGGTLVVLLALLVAGWWFFIREDNSRQKEAAPVSDEVRKAVEADPTATIGVSAQATPTTASATSFGLSSVAGRSYKIVAGQSQAWYLAPEKLASLPTTSTAKGVTSEVSGEFHLTSSGLDPAKPTVFKVGLTKLRSDESRRDDQVRSSLQTSRFPTARFTASALAGMPEEFTAQDTVMQLTGTLELHGVKREVTWELRIKKDGEILSGLATVEFKYSDFAINKPDIGGFVSVDANVTIQIQLFAAPA